MTNADEKIQVVYADADTLSSYLNRENKRGKQFYKEKEK